MTEEKNSTKEIIDCFNEVSKNAGVVSFKVKYTAIPSNRKVHEQFAKFAFEEANNNYLNAINVLLKYKQIFDWFEMFEARLNEVESKMDGLRDFVIAETAPKEEVKEKKKPKLY
jgi:hypothetical protein